MEKGFKPILYLEYDDYELASFSITCRDRTKNYNNLLTILEKLNSEDISLIATLANRGVYYCQRCSIYDENQVKKLFELGIVRLQEMKHLNSVSIKISETGYNIYRLIGIIDNI